MTGFTTDEFKMRAQKLNPVDYIEKPIDINRIKHIIESLKKY